MLDDVLETPENLRVWAFIPTFQDVDQIVMILSITCSKNGGPEI